MIRKISIAQYRKMKNIELEFHPAINAVSGTNGTCKTSLLHIMSNSFQAVNKNCNWVLDNSCIEIIKRINNITNPKIETLTRGDKQYNDPAIGTEGSLFTVDYFDRPPLSFRRHNSQCTNRYSIKPTYKRGTRDSLPYCPVIYLGLSRLFPFGEFQDDTAIKGINKALPQKYQEEVERIYESLTSIKIAKYTAPQKMGDIKVRADFYSDKEGIDSNTISAGEDNLFILITAIVSLKYYYLSIQPERQVESILLIDEFDATLHPTLQIRLMKIFEQYAKEYRIQVVFTTHSLSLLEYILKRKANVIYLIDNLDSVIKMAEPDIYKIKMYLHSISSNDIYTNKMIPIFTEDDEARVFLNIIFDFYERKYGEEFLKVRRFFHFVKTKIGSSNLLTIFEDEILMKSTMRSICVLDGDQNGKRSISKSILVLPGTDSPENFIMKYSMEIFEQGSPFWEEEVILDYNLGKVYYRDNVLPEIKAIDDKIQQLQVSNTSVKGIRRAESKEVFNRHKVFFEFLFKYWVNNEENSAKLELFYEDLYKAFRKTAEFHGINPKAWNKAI